MLGASVVMLGAYAAVVTAILIGLLTYIRAHVNRAREYRTNYGYVPNPPDKRGLR